MVDQEVVDILAEIKQRVVSTKSSEQSAQPSTSGIQSNVPVRPANHDYASLTVLARSWDQLPPLVTNRTGATAKLDLWIKAKMKTAFRWFTWEQVNFNAATHQTFKELIESLAAQQQQLVSIQNELVSYEQRLHQFHQRLVDQIDDLDQRLRVAREQNEQVNSSLNTQMGTLRALQASQQAEVNAKVETLAGQVKTKANQEADIVRELRERHEQILDEHRVSFKQLSLELSEAQVLQDRARRELDARVSKLER